MLQVVKYSANSVCPNQDQAVHCRATKSHIMVRLEDIGLEVKFLVNGSPAVEYSEEEPGAISDGFDRAIPRSHEYIESIDDAEFLA